MCPKEMLFPKQMQVRISPVAHSLLTPAPKPPHHRGGLIRRTAARSMNEISQRLVK